MPDTPHATLLQIILAAAEAGPLVIQSSTVFRQPYTICCMTSFWGLLICLRPVH